MSLTRGEYQDKRVGGCPNKLCPQDERKFMGCFHVLRKEEGQFSSNRLMQQATLKDTEVSNRTVRKFLHKNGYRYLQEIMAQRNTSTSGGKSGNKYKSHFLRSFLLSYGPAIQDITDEDVLKRLHDFNCEWMSRPNIAISEIVMTLKDNLKLFKAYREKVFKEAFVDELEGFITPLLPALKRLDNKDKETTEPPTKSDVCLVLRTIQENVEFERCVRQGYNACGPVFSSAVQVIALATLLNCPAQFAKKCQRTSETDAFKADPSLVTMKDYLLRGIFKNRRPIRQSGSVWNEDDDVEETTPRPRHSQPRQPALSSRRWERRRDDSDNEEEAQPLAAAVRSNSRRQPRATSTPVRDPANRRRELLFPKTTRDASVFASDSDESSGMKCWQCGRQGHIRKDCLNQTTGRNRRDEVIKDEDEAVDVITAKSNL
ncbi:hypothetical protein ACROYT_G014538 [Oculina patagonica]